jgi:hypothetical protein
MKANLRQLEEDSGEEAAWDDSPPPCATGSRI